MCCLSLWGDLEANDLQSTHKDFDKSFRTFFLVWFRRKKLAHAPKKRTRKQSKAPCGRMLVVKRIRTNQSFVADVRPFLVNFYLRCRCQDWSPENGCSYPAWRPFFHKILLIVLCDQYLNPYAMCFQRGRINNEQINSQRPSSS